MVSTVTAQTSELGCPVSYLPLLFLSQLPLV